MTRNQTAVIQPVVQSLYWLSRPGSITNNIQRIYRMNFWLLIWGLYCTVFLPRNGYICLTETCLERNTCAGPLRFRYKQVLLKFTSQHIDISRHLRVTLPRSCMCEVTSVGTPRLLSISLANDGKLPMGCKTFKIISTDIQTCSYRYYTPLPYCTTRHPLTSLPSVATTLDSSLTTIPCRNPCPKWQ